MSSRTKFLKREILKIRNNLNFCHEYATFSGIEEDRQFVKIFDLFMELYEKTNNFKQDVRGSFV